RRRSLRPRARPSLDRARRDADRPVRPRANRRGENELAFPPRPANRCIRPPHAATTRRMTPDPPRALGYRMPAEWEPHAATWLSWPHNVETWPGKFEPVPQVFAQMVAALHEHEAVHILAGSAELEESARQTLRVQGCDGPNVRFFRIPTNDAWMRDH